MGTCTNLLALQSQVIVYLFNAQDIKFELDKNGSHIKWGS